jgi:hypothetical protein
VKERTEEDLRGLVVELVAVDESGKDQMSSLEKPELQKMWSIFSHQKLDLADIVTQVCAMLLSMSSLLMHPIAGCVQLMCALCTRLCWMPAVSIGGGVCPSPPTSTHRNGSGLQHRSGCQAARTNLLQE